MVFRLGKIMRIMGMRHIDGQHDGERPKEYKRDQKNSHIAQSLLAACAIQFESPDVSF